jgi:hypothetical protein
MKPIRMIVAAAAALPLFLASPSFALSEPAPGADPGATVAATATAPLTVEQIAAMERLLDANGAASSALLTSNLMRPDRVEIELSRRGDPMTIPFLVSPIIRRSALDEMNRAHAEGRTQDAIRWAKFLVQEHAGTVEAEAASNLLAVIGKDNQPPIPPPVERKIVFPAGIGTSTRSILFDAEDPMVVVGFDFYRVGEALRDHPNVVVESISAGEVVFRVNEEFGSASFVVAVEAER